MLTLPAMGHIAIADRCSVTATLVVLCCLLGSAAANAAWFKHPEQQAAQKFEQGEYSNAAWNFIYAAWVSDDEAASGNNANADLCARWFRAKAFIFAAKGMKKFQWRQLLRTHGDGYRQTEMIRLLK